MDVMKWLERRFGRFAISHLTAILIICQLFAYVASLADKPDEPSRLEPLYLIPSKVLEGQVWRLVTFLFIPPDPTLVVPYFNTRAPTGVEAFFLLITLYFFWIMGSALEANWGAFRYNVFLLIAVVMTFVAAGVSMVIAPEWLQPDVRLSNTFIILSVFLAFAFLFPDFVFYIMFILPMKVKWIAAVVWMFILWQLIVGEWITRVLVLASVANVLLFFRLEIFHLVRNGFRKTTQQHRLVIDRNKPVHTCAVCGVTDKSDPKMEFRYCPLCDSDTAYCMNHIYKHEHRGKV